MSSEEATERGQTRATDVHVREVDLEPLLRAHRLSPIAGSVPALLQRVRNPEMLSTQGRLSASWE